MLLYINMSIDEELKTYRQLVALIKQDERIAEQLAAVNNLPTALRDLIITHSNRRVKEIMADNTSLTSIEAVRLLDKQYVSTQHNAHLIDYLLQSQKLPQLYINRLFDANYKVAKENKFTYQQGVILSIAKFSKLDKARIMKLFAIPTFLKYRHDAVAKFIKNNLLPKTYIEQISKSPYYKKYLLQNINKDQVLVYLSQNKLLNSQHFTPSVILEDFSATSLTLMSTLPYRSLQQKLARCPSLPAEAAANLYLRGDEGYRTPVVENALLTSHVGQAIQKQLNFLNLNQDDKTTQLRLIAQKIVKEAKINTALTKSSSMIS